MTSEQRLEGRTALVTGAASPLGAAITHALAVSGARVVLAGRRRPGLELVANELDGPSRIELVDVSSPGSVAELAGRLADEHISILVNNAGIGGDVRPLVDVDPDEWDEVFAVNVRGVFLMCRAFLPPMIAAGAGYVINVASVSGKRPLPMRTPYSSSKLAVIGLTSTLAHEVGTAGVMVNSLSPGPVVSARMNHNFARESAVRGVSLEQVEAELVARSALRRMITVDEVGAAVLAMLAMPGLSGADIDLSAGMVAR